MTAYQIPFGIDFFNHPLEFASRLITRVAFARIQRMIDFAIWLKFLRKEKSSLSFRDNVRDRVSIFYRTRRERNKMRRKK